MSFIGSIGSMPSSVTTGYPSTTTGRVRNASTYGMHYPSPFFDIAHMWMPQTMKEMFKLCRYFFMTQPLINTTVFKLSEYPITEIIVEHESRKVQRLWTEYLQDHLRIRPFQIECGLDFNCYGNSLPAVRYPLIKYIICGQCGYGDREDKMRKHYIYTGGKFRLTCPKCKHTGEAEVKERYLKSPGGIKLVRWNPEDVDIEYNDIMGERKYYYTIPDRIKNDVQMGKKDVVGSIPQIFLRAIAKNKGIVFSPDKLFHLHRPTLAGKDRGWGTPLLLPVLKDAYYLQIMKKAQECVAPSTLIETERGLVRAAEVGVGDKVRTHTGAYRPVVQKQVRPMVEDRGDYGVELTVTGLWQLASVFSNNHPMWVLRRNESSRRKDSKEHRRSSYVLRNPSLYEFKWVDAGDVNVGDYAGYPVERSREEQEVDLAKYCEMVSTDQYIYSCVSLEKAQAFEKLTFGDGAAGGSVGKAARRYVAAGSSPNRHPRYLELDEDLAYIAGWYLGDGSTGSRHVDFSMGPDDTGIELQAALQRVFDVTCSSYPSKLSRGWNLCACGTFLSAFLSGWIPGDAKAKMIPKEILSAPDNIVLAFLRGYLEADGYSSLSVRNDESIDVCCSNQQLTYQLWSLLLSLGCISTVSERIAYDTDITKLDGSAQHIEGGRPVFFWSVSSRSARRLGQMLLGEDADVVTSGKSGFFIHGYFAARVFKSEIVPCEEVISFEIEEDHTFCVPGMATHNSILLEHILPLRILFPQAASGSTDPFTTVSLVDWREHVSKEIARWRMDCVTPGTWVETKDGLRKAAEVEEGALLRNHKGTYSRVEKVWRRPLREGERAYRIVARGLSAVRSVFSEGHPLWAARKYNNGNGYKLGSPEFIRVKDLRAGDYVGYPVNRDIQQVADLDLADYTDRACTENWIYVDHVEREVPEAFELLSSGAPPERKEVLEKHGWSVNQYKTAQMAVRDGRCLRRLPRYLPFDEELAWVVGLYLAEGNVAPKQVMFAAHAEETATIERLKKFFMERFGAEGFCVTRSEYGVQLYFSSIIAAQFFGNLCPGTALTKHIPEVFRTANRAAVIALLHGMHDGDGCWHEDGYSDKASYCSASLQLAEDYRRLLMSLGVPASITYTSPHEYNILGKKGWSSGVYYVWAHGAAKAALKSLFEGQFPVSEVASHAGVFQNGYFWHRIRKIEQVEAEEVIGFQTDSSVVHTTLDDGEVHGTFCTWGMGGGNSNYIPILPLPIGQQTLGGDGRALLLSGEMQQWSEQIVAGMGVPREFVFGGLSYSGTNVSMRMVENAFLSYIMRQLAMVRWIVQEVATFLEWPVPKIRFKPFKMADDLQRKAFLAQLNEAGKLSDTSLLAECDYVQNEENQIMMRETAERLEATRRQQLASAQIQADSQIVMAKAQAKSQQVMMEAQQAPPAPGEPGGPETQVAGGSPGAEMAEPGAPPPPGAGMPPGPPHVSELPQMQQQEMQSPLGMQSQPQQGMAHVDPSHVAQLIAQMPPEQQQLALQSIYQQSPELAEMVQQILMQMQQQSPHQAVDMRPNPDQLPPRRNSPTI